MKSNREFVVVGGGIVGASIAYGLLQAGRQVTLLDGGPGDPKASVANFGLVWVQGKGPNLPAYQILTREASDAWPAFSEGLLDAAGQKLETVSPDLAYEREGGLTFCLSEEDYQDRENYLNRLHNESGGLSKDCQMISRREVEELLPGFRLGPEVVGASYCWRDGCVNPLNLSSILYASIRRLGGSIMPNTKVHGIDRKNSIWQLVVDGGLIEADNIVIAAGLETQRLAKLAGLNVPVHPQRGQILVSERRPRTMRLPASTLRQTVDGSFLVGATKEDVGFDTSTTTNAAHELARRIVRIHPDLENIKVVRQWGGLRIMTPDGAPVYEFGDGVSAVACHSGITLTPIHAVQIVDRILAGDKDTSLDTFSSARFKAAPERLAALMKSQASI
ncbi:MAG: FAD-dependent oxidoreductase [Pseudomonadota bacterium]